MECMIKGVPAGIGDPVFDKLDALLAQAVMSIGAVKAVEIGDGVKVSETFGSKNNDQFKASAKGIISKKTNHAGGILGGISDSPQVVILNILPKEDPAIYSSLSASFRLLMP